MKQHLHLWMMALGFALMASVVACGETASTDAEGEEAEGGEDEGDGGTDGADEGDEEGEEEGEEGGGEGGEGTGEGGEGVPEGDEGTVEGDEGDFEGDEGEGLPPEGVEGVGDEGGEGAACVVDSDCGDAALVCYNDVCTQFCAIPDNQDEPQCANDPCAVNPQSLACICQNNPQDPACTGGPGEWDPNCELPGDGPYACHEFNCCLDSCGQNDMGCQQSCQSDPNAVTPACNSCIQTMQQCFQDNGCIIGGTQVDQECALTKCEAEYNACFAPSQLELPPGKCEGENVSCEFIGNGQYACVPLDYPNLTNPAGTLGGPCDPADPNSCGGPEVLCGPFQTAFCTVGCEVAEPPPPPTGGPLCPNFEACAANCPDPSVDPTGRECIQQCRDADPGCNDCLRVMNQCFGYNKCYDAAGNVTNECVFDTCGDYYDACFGGQNPPATTTQCPGFDACANACPDPNTDPQGSDACVQQCFDAEGAGCNQCRTDLSRCLGEESCPDQTTDPVGFQTCLFQDCGAYYDGCFGANPAPATDTQCPGFEACADACPDPATDPPGNEACVGQCFDTEGQACNDCRGNMSRCLFTNGCYAATGEVDPVCLYGECDDYYAGCFGPNDPPSATVTCPSARDCLSKCPDMATDPQGAADCEGQCIDADGDACGDCYGALQRCELEAGCWSATGRDQACSDTNCKAYSDGCYGAAATP